MGAVKSYFTDPDSVYFRRTADGRYPNIERHDRIKKLKKKRKEKMKINALKIVEYFKRKEIK